MAQRLARVILPLSWILAVAGYCGPWIAHGTAALTLAGPDMGEFIKFLPGVLNGSLRVVRQLFYLPPVAVALSVSLLVGSKPLHYSWLLRVVALTLSLVASVQLLPPAWSPASLVTSEFRLQPVAMGVCWLALAGFWFLGRLPVRLSGLLSCGLAFMAGALSMWQFLASKRAIDVAYGASTEVGWGYLVCLAGLLAIACASLMLAFSTASEGRK